MTSPSTIMYRRASHSEDLVVDSVSLIYLEKCMPFIAASRREELCLSMRTD